MATFSPEEPNPDELADILLRLGQITEPVDVVDVTQLSDPVLVERLVDLDGRLQEMGESIFASTPEGRELHSLRGAIIIEQRRRR
jgi:hypothetical protein